MKISLELGPDGSVRAYVKMQGTEAHLLGSNPTVASTLMAAFGAWITDITSEVRIVEDELPDVMLSTRVFEPGIDFFDDPEDMLAANESSEHKHTPLPKFLTKDVEDIFKGPAEE